MLADLPPGWSRRKLTDVVSLPTGQVDPQSLPYRNQPLLAPDHVESKTGRIIALRTAESQGASSGKYVVRPGDVVLSKIRPALRKVALAEFEGTCSADMYPMRPLGGLLPEILHAELLSERFSLFAESVSGRTGIPKINRSDLDSYEINIPPVVEQYRIVEILRSVQDRIDAEQIALRKSDSLWNGALNAELERHFLDYAPSKLVEVSLGGGEYGSNSSASPHRVDMPRYVRITDIDDRGFLARADSAAASIPLTAARRYLLEAGDLLIARTGFTTGKSYLYRASDGVCAFAGYLVRFRINPREMVPEYAFLWTTGNMFRGWVSRNVREVGQRNISAREYNDHEIAHPPVSVQRRLADAARIARESRQLRTLEIDRLYTLRSALAGDLLGDRASSSTVH